MDKRLGSSAGILALVALLLHTFGFLDGDKSVSAPPKNEASVTSTAAAGAAGLQLLDKQGPWRATQQYFHTDLVSAEGRACQSYLLGLPQPACSQKALLSLFGFEPTFDPSNLRFLIATIADPLHTRMAIESDRDLDAIQRAAFRSGWELATQWLPWTLKLSGTRIQSASSQDPVEMETFPGVLVFRHHFEPGSKVEQLLAVMVVAETPTAGVNGLQFEVARRALSLLRHPASSSVFIAGPRFSGSFLSLTELLDRWPSPQRFVLQAGSVSNSDYAAAMLSKFASRQSARAKKHQVVSAIEFHGSTLPSVAFENHFANLVRRLKVDPQQAASLIEDETGFSVAKDQNATNASTATRIPVYRYPRDIAQVRNTYNDAAFAPPSIKSDTSPVPALEFSLKDTQAGEDIFPIFSTSHTPVSQNAELQQTIRYLRRKGVRIASLSATNVFDTIFLANILSRTCPDMRIVLRGPDLLFVQEAAQGSLSGLLAISPFPMFPEGNAWNDAYAHDTSAFASADQIGEFDAVTTLLYRQSVALAGGEMNQQEPPPVIEPYEQPFGRNRDSVMSAWLLELGSTGWVPIDLLPQINPPVAGQNANGSWFYQENLPTSHEKFLHSPIHVRWGWIGLCTVCALFTLAFCGRLLYLYLQPHRLVWSNLCIVDIRGFASSKGIVPVVHHRYLCMVCCYSTLSFLNGLLLCPMLAMKFHYGVDANFGVGSIVAIAFLASLATALYLSISIPIRVGTGTSFKPDPESARLVWESVCIRIGVLAVPFFATCLWWTCCGSENAGYLMCFRTLNLSAPLAPLWPLFISGCGLFTLCYFHLRRFTWAYRRQPHLDTSTFDQILCDEFGRLRDGLEENLYKPSAFAGFPVMPKALAIALTVIVVLCFLSQFETLSSFEPSGFMRVFEFLQVPLAVFTLISFGRFLRCWSLLRALLVSLNSVALGRFFERVPEFSGNGPVWIREMKFISLASAINSVIALRNLVKIGSGANYASCYLDSLRNFLLVSESAARTRLKFIRRYDTFRRRANAISVELSTSILEPYWRENVLPYVGFSSLEATAGVAARTTAVAPAAGLLSQAAAAGTSYAVPHPLSTAIPPANSEALPVTEEAYNYASKYIALQYSIFIGYCLLHLQNLLLCSTVCFAFIVVALNSYVFQIPEILSYLLSGGLVLAAVAGILVLAQVERDPILSRLSGTPEGALGKDFYWRAAAYGVLPVLSILSTQFPAMARFLSSWVEPALSKLQ